jgi:hypothetical protein
LPAHCNDALLPVSNLLTYRADAQRCSTTVPNSKHPSRKRDWHPRGTLGCIDSLSKVDSSFAGGWHRDLGSGSW